MSHSFLINECDKALLERINRKVGTFNEKQGKSCYCNVSSSSNSINFRCGYVRSTWTKFNFTDGLATVSVLYYFGSSSQRISFLKDAVLWLCYGLSKLILCNCQFRRVPNGQSTDKCLRIVYSSIQYCGDFSWSSRCLLRGQACLLYTSPSPRDAHESRMPASA